MALLPIGEGTDTVKTATASTVSECTPDEAWADLSSANAVLVDVRTREEWNFVGVPELSSTPSRLIFSQWQRLPGMSVSETFAADLAAEIGDVSGQRLFFICRSGKRSLDAAKAMAAWFEVSGESADCVNVTGGFEGDLDNDKHRGWVNGWKKCGLPWQQG